MPAPFYNAIKGTTSGTPGTGAFTPNAASTGFRAWSTVPTGWIGMVRYEDSTDWELTYSYWNGTTLSRASTQRFDSSTGSALTLTSAATAAMVPDASEVQSHLGSTAMRGWFANVNSTTIFAFGAAAVTVTGTAGAQAIATTNFLTEQIKEQVASATTANAQAGWSSQASAFGVISTAAGRGGFEFVARFGASTLPTGPRLFVGTSQATYIASTAEPSTLVSDMAVFALDSTDTNIQLLVNNNSGSGTKTDTGIPLVANGFYEASIWADPGSNKIYGLLIRLDTGAIWFGSTTTDVPSNGATVRPFCIGGLNGTNTGTAFTMQISSMTMRLGC